MWGLASLAEVAPLLPGPACVYGAKGRWKDMAASCKHWIGDSKGQHWRFILVLLLHCFMAAVLGLAFLNCWKKSKNTRLPVPQGVDNLS